jgi:asparagine synthase (glutamine-hydrolysing)
MAREHVVVALNGDGGDEALGGYMRYPYFLQASNTHIPSGLVRTAGRAAAGLQRYRPGSRVLRRVASAGALLSAEGPADRYARFLSYFRPEEKDRLLAPEFKRQAGVDSVDIVRQVWADHQRTDDVNRLLAVDTYTYLPGDLLAKVDITTMAVSLEARSPFLDHLFMEWAAALPGNLKVRDGTTKYLFKRALEPWLPTDLIHRRKMGFGVPMADWLRGPLRELTYDLLTDQSARSRGWFVADEVDAIVAAHMAGQDRSPHLYALLMLEMWHREVLEPHRMAKV